MESFAIFVGACIGHAIRYVAIGFMLMIGMNLATKFLA